MIVFRRFRPFRRGFTLVELLIALSILGLISVMLATSFYSVNRSWAVGREVIDSGGHSDYLMEQLTAALRSAYTPGTGEKHGFIFVDDGEERDAKDTIEWSKIGSALVGEEARYAEVPHRVRVYVSEPDGPGHPGGFTVKAWRQDLQTEEFDPEEDAAELCLSPRVIAFNCRMLDPDTPRTTDDEINWVDAWTKTNTLPDAVEITLWMRPPEEDADPIERRRIVELPMGALSKNPESGANSGAGVRQSGRRPGAAGGGGPMPPHR